MQSDYVGQPTNREVFRGNRDLSGPPVRRRATQFATARSRAGVRFTVAVAGPTGRQDAGTTCRHDVQEGRSADTSAAIHGDTSMRDQLVMEHLGLVKAMASRLSSRLPSQVEQEDLVSVGMIGLIDAAGRFRPALGVPFSAFARRRIHGAMLDSLRALDWASRATRKQRREVDRAVATMRCSLGREPEVADMAQALDMSKTEYERMLDALKSSERRVICRHVVDEDGRSALDLAIEPSEGQHDRLEREEMLRLLAGAVGLLPDREREVLALYYGKELTLAAIGALIGVGESRVSQLRSQAIARLRSNLVDGITPAAPCPTHAQAPRAARSARRAASRVAVRRRTELQLPCAAPPWARGGAVADGAPAHVA